MSEHICTDVAVCRSDHQEPNIVSGWHSSQLLSCDTSNAVVKQLDDHAIVDVFELSTISAESCCDLSIAAVTDSIQQQQQNWLSETGHKNHSPHLSIYICTIYVSCIKCRVAIVKLTSSGIGTRYELSCADW